MPKPGFIVFIFFVIWFSATRAAAQQNPFQCDSLKVLCFSEEKIKVRFFNAPKTCPETCAFCAAVAKEDWLEVQKQLKLETKSLRGSTETIKTLRNWLLGHRLVNFVLPPYWETQSGKTAALQFGMQVPHMTYTWNATFLQKPARKTKPAYWKFTTFQSDGTIYSRLNQMGTAFQANLNADTLHLPKPLLPDQNFLASWFGTRNYTPAEYASLEAQIRNNPKETVKNFVQQKDSFGLLLLMAHQNLAVRYLALQGVKTLHDKNCLPFLLRLAETIIHPADPNMEISTLYMNYCEQLVSTIGILSDCSFNRCPYAHYPPQHYLQLGLPTWESRIDHRFGQGIGTYGYLL